MRLILTGQNISALKPITERMTYMKKLLPLIISMLLVISSLTLVSSAANAPTVLWDFGKATANDMEAAIAEFNSINADYDLHSTTPSSPQRTPTLCRHSR